MGSKVCKNCGVQKDLSRYVRDKSYKEGYRHKCKDCDAERSRIASRAYYHKNKEQKAKSSRAWVEANKTYVKERRQRHYLANKDKELAQVKEWAKANPDKRREYKARRKALLRNLTVETLDYSQIRQTATACYLCQEAFADEERVDGALTHVDHIIPISRGGAHSYENTALTHAFCNLSKNAKVPAEYLT